MSITYFLYLAEEVDPAAFELPLGAGAIDVAASRVGPPTDAYVEEDFGLRPRVRLVIRLDTDQLDAAQDQVVALVAQVLEEVPGDLLLLREGETIAVARRRDRCELGNDALWTVARRRAAIAGFLKD